MSSLYILSANFTDLLISSRLASLMAPNIQAYCLPMTFACQPSLRTIEGEATRLRNIVNKMEPAGVIRLLAWGASAAVAYELAQQLLGEDREVGFLAIVNHVTLSELSEVPQSGDEESWLSHLAPRVPHANRTMTATSSGGTLRSRIMADDAYELPLSPELFREIAAAASDIRAPLFPLGEYVVHPITIPIHFFVGNDDNGAGRSDCPDEFLHSYLANARLSSQQVRVDISGLDMCSLAASFTNYIEHMRNRPRPIVDFTHQSLVLIKLGRCPECNLICIPGAGASIASYMNLSELLDDKWTVYGLQPRGLDHLRVPHSTVRAAARVYFNAIIDAHLTTPIHIIGHSFGGWIALALAQMFHDAGRPIASLVLVDSNAPDEDYITIREYSNTAVIMKWIEVFELLLKRPLYITVPQIQLRDPEQQMVFLHRILVQTGLMPKRSRSDSLRGPLRSFATSLRTTYCPIQIYPGRAHLLVADDSQKTTLENQDLQQNTIGKWKKWIPSLTSSLSAGDHLSVLKTPYVETLIDILKTF